MARLTSFFMRSSLNPGLPETPDTPLTACATGAIRVGAVYRIRVLGDGATIEGARVWFEGRPDVVAATIRPDGEIEIGFQGDDEGAARLLSDAVRSGGRRSERRGASRP